MSINTWTNDFSEASVVRMTPQKRGSEGIIQLIINRKHLIFEVTDACNLHCKYCGYADLYKGYDKRKNLRFPFTRAKRVIDYLYELWKKNCVEDAVSPK